MTKHMPDERLAELRALANLTDQEDHWWALHNETELEAVGIDDLRSLLARLDAAEDLLREVARESDVCFFEVGKWMSTEIKIATLEKCRSYLR